MHLDVYGQVSFKLCMMIKTTIVYSLILVLVTFTYIQGHRVVRKQNLVCLCHILIHVMYWSVLSVMLFSSPSYNCWCCWCSYCHRCHRHCCFLLVLLWVVLFSITVMHICFASAVVPSPQAISVCQTFFFRFFFTVSNWYWSLIKRITKQGMNSKQKQ